MRQVDALTLLKNGENVFLTGSAGAGKSYTIQQYLKYLEDSKVHYKKIAITSTTGISAVHIQGQTIHSWSCIGIKDDMSDEELQHLGDKQSPRLKRIFDTQVLIIDEISMFHRKQFELVDKVLRYVKGNHLPFGGIQVLLTGDFFQLPPISKQMQYEESNRDRFCFMSPVWAELKLKVCYLTEQHRNGVGPLNQLLNEIRSSSVSKESLAAIEDKLIVDSESDHLPTLRLYTHNKNVDYINHKKLKEIDGESKIFKAKHEGNRFILEMLTKSILAPEHLELKIGAKVMFIKNNPDGDYVNGTQGEVFKFVKNDEYDPPFVPVIKTTSGRIVEACPANWDYTENNKIIARVTQIPLKLAWAITIHKAQGMTLDEAIIDIRSAFDHGMGYVALSRLKDISGLSILGYSPQALQLNPLAIKADARFKELSAINEEEVQINSELHKDLQAKFLKSLKI